MTINDIYLKYLRDILKNQPGYVSADIVNDNLCVFVTDKKYIVGLGEKILDQRVRKCKILFLVIGLSLGKDILDHEILNVVNVLK